MRKETIGISERNLMFAVAGQLFDQAPNRQPRKAEIIMRKVRDVFRKGAQNQNEFYYVRIESGKLYDWLKDILFAIPEFQELNLSQVEFENGVKVGDGSRAKFNFTSRYDVYNSESWKSDFVDLDAFVRNACNMLFAVMELEKDCFGCVHQDDNNSSTLACGNDDECKTCSVNPNLKDNFKCSRRPRGKYTFACKYDCFKNRYICCEECDEKEACYHRCDGKSADCGNAINRICGEEE